jgi:hypothetical protein
MRCSWFSGIDWEAVYRREGPGPWLPPEDPIITRRKKLQAEKEAEERRKGGIDDVVTTNDVTAPMDVVGKKDDAQADNARAEDDDMHLPGWEISNEAKPPKDIEVGVASVKLTEVSDKLVDPPSSADMKPKTGSAAVGSGAVTATINANTSASLDSPSAQSSSELMNVDDSLLAPSRLPANALRVVDWSYMDASMIQKAKENDRNS